MEITNENRHREAKTIFMDLDGSLIEHKGTYDKMINEPAIILPGVLDFLEQMSQEMAYIVITTARSEEHRKETEAQLAAVGIKYDRLIMDITAGERWLINDTKTHMPVTARAFVVERNTGLGTLLSEKYDPNGYW